MRSAVLKCHRAVQAIHGAGLAHAEPVDQQFHLGRQRRETLPRVVKTLGSLHIQHDLLHVVAFSRPDLCGWPGQCRSIRRGDRPLELIHSRTGLRQTPSGVPDRRPRSAPRAAGIRQARRAGKAHARRGLVCAVKLAVDPLHGSCQPLMDSLGGSSPRYAIGMHQSLFRANGLRMPRISPCFTHSAGRRGREITFPDLYQRRGAACR